jgi:hypothetical protein
MRPTRYLDKLNRSVQRRATFLRSLVEYQTPPVAASSDRLVAFVTIETLNLWASFTRSFYLSCTLNARRITGSKVVLTAASFHTTADAITFAVKNLTGRKGSGPWRRRDEPTWHNPQTVLTLFTVTGASNLAVVQAGLSYPTSLFTMLPTARNFFAHRNEETAQKALALARALVVPTTARPTEVLCSKAPGRPQNVLSDWLDDLKNVADLMCQ